MAKQLTLEYTDVEIIEPYFYDAFIYVDPEAGVPNAFVVEIDEMNVTL